MTPEQQYLTTMAQAQAAQLRDPPPTAVCPASPEGAMPLQSATLPHKNFPISESWLVAATQRGVSDATAKFVAEYESNLARECEVSAKNLDLRPEKMWQVQPGERAVEWAMNPEPKMESYEGIPADVINNANILGSDMPTQVLRKLEEQMKGKWAMVRLPPEEMVNVRGEQRPVDEYCVATPVACAVPTRAEALAMREMVEKAAEAMRGRGSFVGKSVPELIAQSAPIKFKAELRFDEGTKVVEGSYDPSFLDRPRQHDSPLSARVVPAGEAPDPKVGW